MLQIVRGNAPESSRLTDCLGFCCIVHAQNNINIPEAENQSISHDTIQHYISRVPNVLFPATLLSSFSLVQKFRNEHFHNPHRSQIPFVTYLYLLLLAQNSTLSSRNPLPGPVGLPVFGNVFQFPAENPWRQLKIWAEKYGPIYQISALGKTFIVLGSEEVANDLLRTRGDIYSDRHYITVLRDEIHLPVIKYGGKHIWALRERPL